jgi:hypothetical protein
MYVVVAIATLSLSPILQRVEVELYRGPFMKVATAELAETVALATCGHRGALPVSLLVKLPVGLFREAFDLHY